MKKRTDIEIKEFFETLVGEKLKIGDDVRNDEVLKITFKDKDSLEIELSQMYEYLEVQINYETLKKVSEFFETENINVDQDFSSGCETCDYGSKYTHTFYIKKMEK